MRRVLLDTNAYSALLKGDQRVFDVLAKAERIYVSSVVLGELLAGFRGGSRFLENKRRLEQFMGRAQVELLAVGVETADIYGAVKQRLKQAGKPIPINDIWIASHALETGAVLISYDKHFQQVVGVRLWDEIQS